MSLARDIADLASVTTRLDTVGAASGSFGVGRNVLVNGAMNVAQRATSATGLGGNADSYHTIDRFKLGAEGTTAGRLTMTQDSSGPSGFANSLKLACTTADTSIGSGELLVLSQIIEGQDLQRFAKGTSDAKPFAVSFYVKGNASATYVCELFDGDNSRHVCKTFSVTTDWTRVELSFPADTTGAFGDDNGASLYLQIFLHAGSSFNSGTLPATWASKTNANRAAGGGSFFDSTARTFFITGIQLEETSVTDFEHRSFGDELVRCMRYCQNLSAITANPYLANATVHTSTVMTAIINLGVQMRTTPTVTLSGTAGNYSTYEKATARVVTAYGTNGFSASGGGINFTVASGLTIGSAAGVYITSGADTKSIIEAEL